MSPSPLETYYLSLQEPLKSALLYLRAHLLSDEEMADCFKWSLPFFTFKGKNFCYFWTDKKTSLPYIAFYRGREIDHPILESGERKMIRVLAFDPEEDLPMEQIDEVVTMAKALY